ncbi:nuclear transport factor 2 family protein [Streptomyces sp. NPDC050418]|uniref:nuclear transport factor 2 family protein n=1 Tax=Streptomyces sp. NPDC050418 TaxID=3365612 RepID=UPI0037A744B9
MADNRLDPTVAQLVDALNAGDSDAFFALLTEDASMSDDGTERDLRAWIGSEAFGSNGRMDVESVADGGTSLIATYTNDRWGAMRTAWRFTVADGKVSRFETGQA